MNREYRSGFWSRQRFEERTLYLLGPILTESAWVGPCHSVWV